MLMKLHPITERLKTETGDLSITKSSLALMLMQFLQFMEDVAGKNVRKNICHLLFLDPMLRSHAHAHAFMFFFQGTYKSQPKIPVKTLQDYRPDGPIFALALRIHQIKKMRGLASIDFGNSTRKREVKITQYLYATSLHARSPPLPRWHGATDPRKNT